MFTYEDNAKTARSSMKKTTARPAEFGFADEQDKP